MNLQTDMSESRNKRGGEKPNGRHCLLKEFFMKRRRKRKRGFFDLIVEMASMREEAIKHTAVVYKEMSRLVTREGGGEAVEFPLSAFEAFLMFSHVQHQYHIPKDQFIMPHRLGLGGLKKLLPSIKPDSPLLHDHAREAILLIEDNFGIKESHEAKESIRRYAEDVLTGKIRLLNADLDREMMRLRLLHRKTVVSMNVAEFYNITSLFYRQIANDVIGAKVRETAVKHPRTQEAAKLFRRISPVLEPVNPKLHESLAFLVKSMDEALGGGR